MPYSGVQGKAAAGVSHKRNMNKPRWAPGNATGGGGVVLRWRVGGSARKMCVW